ncbi:MAG TPA: hypothetical protein VGR71_05870, partial [Nitrospira sp.]|nr:hypothetical protein [Nitrospira sp.]
MVVSEKGERGAHTERRDRMLGAGTSAILVVLVAMIVFAPLAVARPVASSLKAPFSGSVVSTYRNVVAQGCGLAYNVKNPSWNASTGKGVLAEYAAANSCASQSGYVGANTQGYSFGEYDIGIPVNVGGNGYYHFKVDWATHFAVAKSYTAGTCVVSNSTPYYCDAFALWYASAGAGLYDATNNSWLQYTTALVCWNGGCLGLTYYPFPVWTGFNETHN